MDTRDLLKHIRAQFLLDWQGIHGAPHWGRVLDNGLRLTERMGARSDVVTLFPSCTTRAAGGSACPDSMRGSTAGKIWCCPSSSGRKIPDRSCSFGM
jgi:hypothetical protein